MSRHALLGLRQEVGLVAHLVGPAAAAGLGVAEDAEGHAGLLQHAGRRLRQVALLVAGQAADVIEHVDLLLGGVGEAQALGPIAALALHRHHAARGPQPRDHLVQGRMSMPILDGLDAQLLDGTQHFHVHRVLARGVAAAAQMAVVDAVEIARRVREPVLQTGGAHVEPTATRVEVEVVLRNAGAHVRVLEPLDLLQGDELARRASAAHVHVAGIFF